jgi:hypothetical protein
MTQYAWRNTPPAIQGTHQSLVFQISFVADHEHGEFIPILHPKDLSVELVHLIKACLVSDRKHEEETFT